jgi:hypothetical protein
MVALMEFFFFFFFFFFACLPLDCFLIYLLPMCGNEKGVGFPSLLPCLEDGPEQLTPYANGSVG